MRKIVITPKHQIQPKPAQKPDFIFETPKLGRMKTVYKLLAELNPAPYNPRYMTDKARQGLSNNIDEFGLVQPIVWNERTGNIVGGHQRFEDLKKKNVEGTDVVVVNLTLEKEKKLNMLLNNKHIEGSFTQGAIDILREIEANEGIENYASMQLDGLEAEIANTFNLNVENEKPIPPPGKPKPDLSANIDEKYEVVVECSDAFGQQAIYDQLTTMGLKCRLLTL